MLNKLAYRLMLCACAIIIFAGVPSVDIDSNSQSTLENHSFMIDWSVNVHADLVSEGYHGGRDWCKSKPGIQEIIDHNVGHCNRFQLMGLILTGLVAIAIALGAVIGTAPATATGLVAWLVAACQGIAIFGAIFAAAMFIIAFWCNSTWTSINPDEEC